MLVQNVNAVFMAKGREDLPQNNRYHQDATVGATAVKWRFVRVSSIHRLKAFAIAAIVWYGPGVNFDRRGGKLSFAAGTM